MPFQSLLSALAKAFGICLLLTSPLYAQKNWQLKSSIRTGGAGVEAAYSLLQGRPAQTVIVAVIDIGTDVNHEDLKDVIWTNPGEIPDNGIDDDHNGYIDDIHGWNFLGGPGGDLMYEATEETRIYQEYKRKIAGWDTTRLSPGQQEVFNAYRKWAKRYRKDQQKRVEDASAMERASRMNRQLHWRILFRILGGKGVSAQLAQARNQAARQLEYNTLDVDSIRRVLVGDDPQNPSGRFYGNNHVTGPDASHGTHTAGIIGAIRGNHLGMEGVAGPVRLMVIRAVPWGDERDKDIANAIRYAVDNGARVINMSFGKYASPDRAVVDAAVQYARERDVLLVHAAGNEGRNTDSIKCFPNPHTNNGPHAPHWIEVGASGSHAGPKRTASFSNYGKETVDLFAPGMNIYSTIPGNQYEFQSGTSMAAPVVTGVAALIRAYFPALTAPQLRDLLLKTARHEPEAVRQPGNTGVLLRLEDLCRSGGLVDAEAAVRTLLQEQGH